MVMNNQKMSDYIVLWNVGASIAYAFSAVTAIVSCMEHFGGLQTSLLISPDSSFKQELAFAIASLILSCIVCVLNAVYARRYFRGESVRTPSGFVATIGFLVLVCYQAS